MTDDQMRAMFKSEHPTWVPIGPIFPEEAAEITRNGKARNANGNGRSWKTKTPGSGDEFHIAGMAGEWAAQLLYGGEIGAITSSSARHLNAVGDIAGFIECRAVRSLKPEKWAVYVAKKDCKVDRPYVMIIACWWPIWLAIAGWCWGHEFFSLGTQNQFPWNPDPTWGMRHDQMRDPMSLFDVIRSSPKAHPSLKVEGVDSDQWSMPPTSWRAQ